MARVKSKGMKPELKVRRLLHGLGYRYRLHRPDLPGQPDLVFPSRRKVVFVNGCFWHNHPDCPRVRVPAANRSYWLSKLNRTRRRDEHNIGLLRRTGWEVLTVWECQLRDMDSVTEQLIDFIETPRLVDDTLLNCAHEGSQNV